MRHDMLYLKQNAEIPFDQVTSTARRGDKWTKVKPGDKLILRYTENNERFGLGIVTSAKLVTFGELIERAAENHVGQRIAFLSPEKKPEEVAAEARQVLEAELKAAYGADGLGGLWTMVYFIRPSISARDLAYWAIDTERDYQDAQRGNSKPHDEHRDRPLSTGECLYCIEELLDQARKHWYRPDGRDDALHAVRKIGAVAVQCMENHGAMFRD